MDIQERIVRFILLFLLAGVVFAQTDVTTCPQTVHRDVKGFGLNCKYRCNCANKEEQCDYDTGKCQSGCLRGWMGPGCQYRNYASELTINASQFYGAENNSSRATRAIDGDVNTCSRTGSLGQSEKTKHWWKAQFHTALYIIGLVIKIPDSETAKFKGFTVELDSVTCYEHGTDVDGESAMEINCIRPMASHTLRITLAENVNSPLVLCEVEVYGGRLVSFNMPTNSSGVKEYRTGSFWNPFYAVDGRQMYPDENQDNVTERTCAGTGDDTEPETTLWWSVDLGAIFSIQGFDFFGRLGRRDQFTPFLVMAGYKYTQTFRTLLKDDPSPYANAYNPKTVTLKIPVLGNIVRVVRRSKTMLVICEFEVFAECPLGKCGLDCNTVCMCKNQTTGPKKIEGTCPYGCSGRWTGSQGKCDKECSNTTWGPDCNTTCGHCKNDIPCSVSNGTCQDSCKAGWYPPYCVIACDKGLYGEDCTATCGNCWGNSTCNHEDGACTRCKAGYHETTCKSAESHVEKDGQSITVALGIIIGLSVAIIIAVAVIITVLIVRKRRNRQTTDSSVYVDCNTSAPDVHNYDILVSSRNESQSTELHIYENRDDAR